MTTVTGVIAVSAVIAGIILLGPVLVAPHGGQGSRASRDLRAGRDRRDPHGGHGPTAAAVIAWGRTPVTSVSAATAATLPARHVITAGTGTPPAP